MANIKVKIAVFSGNRATVFRLERVITALSQHPDIELQHIHIEAGTNYAQTVARVYKGVENHVKRYKPNWGMVCADRYEALPAAMGFCYNRIPLVHCMAGDESGCID